MGALVGVIPMLIVNLATSLMDFFLNSSFSGKQLGYSSWEQLKDVAPSYGIAISVAMSVWFLKYLPLSNWVILPIQIGIGVSVLLFLCHITQLNEYKETRSILALFLVKFKHK